MENKAEVLWINWINECLALADADDLSIFYAFIHAYQEEKKKKQQKNYAATGPETAQVAENKGEQNDKQAKNQIPNYAE